MNIGVLIIVIITILLLITLIGLTLYQIRIDTITRERTFELQIEMSKGQQAMTKELPWKELKAIVDEIISFTVINYCITNGITKMTDAELSLEWVVILTEVCSSVDSYLSEEIRRQILKNVSEEYLSQYIKNSVQLTIVYNIDKNKENRVNNRLRDIQYGVIKNTKKEESVG